MILRDAQVLPALRAILEGGLLRYLDQAHQVLTEPLGARGRRHQPVDAAARAAIDLRCPMPFAAPRGTWVATTAPALLHMVAA